MSDAFKKLALESHQLQWKDELPFSLDANDIFFQDEALNEIEHVFIKPNEIKHRSSVEKNLIVGEIGFGFGLNFLSTCQTWIQNSNEGLLTYLSIDHKIASHDEIKKLFKKFNELNDLEMTFFDCFEPIHQGINKFFFPQWSVELIIYVGDVLDAISDLDKNFKADAWYLDGFDPKLNNVMWSDPVLDFIQMHSYKNTTISTFTAAGFVRRGLTQKGFEVERKKGFKFKRHHITGKYSKLSKEKNPKKIAIIGSGIAGCSTAYHLAKNGHVVEIFEIESEISSGASGNPLAALYPRFNLNNEPLNLLNFSSFYYADRFYKSLDCDGYFETGIGFKINDKRTESWIKKLKALNREDLFSFSDNQNKTGLKDFRGVIFNHGGYIDPKKINQSLLDNENIKIHLRHEFKNFEIGSSNVTLRINDNNQCDYDYLVLAHGSGLINFSNDLSLSKGQLVAAKISNSIKMPINSSGYILPAKDGLNWIGASYDHQFKNLDVDEDKLKKMIALQEDQYGVKNNSQQYDSRAQIRTVSKNKLPIVGKYKQNENIIMLGGFGSRGFCYGPILGDHVASIIDKSPSPLEKNIATSLLPKNFK
jgi:tRNA 5-methylaminomethyl-2-thiouridine biosynthesis bifunctional protein